MRSQTGVRRDLSSAVAAAVADTRVAAAYAAAIAAATVTSPAHATPAIASPAHATPAIAAAARTADAIAAAANEAAPVDPAPVASPVAFVAFAPWVAPNAAQHVAVPRTAAADLPSAVAPRQLQADVPRVPQ